MLETGAPKPRGRPPKLKTLSFLPENPHLSDVTILYDELGYSESKSPRHVDFYADLNTYLEGFKSCNRSYDWERLDLQNQDYRDMLVKMTKGFLDSDGRGDRYWPSAAPDGSKLPIRYFSHKAKILEKVLHLFLILNWDLNRKMYQSEMEAPIADPSLPQEQSTLSSIENPRPDSELGDDSQAHGIGSAEIAQPALSKILKAPPSRAEVTVRPLGSLRPYFEDVADEDLVLHSNVEGNGYLWGASGYPRDVSSSPDPLGPSSPHGQRYPSRTQKSEQAARNRRKGKQVMRSKQAHSSHQIPPNSAALLSNRVPEGPQTGPSGSHAATSQHLIGPQQSGNPQRRRSNTSLSSARRPPSSHRVQGLTSIPQEISNLCRGSLICTVFTQPWVNEVWNPKDADFMSLDQLRKAIPIEAKYSGLSFVLACWQQQKGRGFRTAKSTGPLQIMRHMISNHDEVGFQAMKCRFNGWMDLVGVNYSPDQYFLFELAISPIS